MATTTEPAAAVRTVGSPENSVQEHGQGNRVLQSGFRRKGDRCASRLGGEIPHAEIMIGDSVLMLADEWPEGGRFSAETLGTFAGQHSTHGSRCGRLRRARRCRRGEGDPAGRQPVLRTPRRNGSRSLRLHMERLHGDRGNVGRGDASPHACRATGAAERQAGSRSGSQRLSHDDAVHRGGGCGRPARLRQERTFGGEEIFRTVGGGGRHARRSARGRFHADGGRRRRRAEVAAASPKPFGFHSTCRIATRSTSARSEAGGTSIAEPSRSVLRRAFGAA